MRALKGSDSKDIVEHECMNLRGYKMIKMFDIQLKYLCLNRFEAIRRFQLSSIQQILP